jgi:hypothetical protein
MATLSGHLQPELARNVIDPRRIQGHTTGIHRSDQAGRLLPQ